ncbi:aspartate/glutamate racemase family protein [Mesobacterium pallidum]|uniref:aspartate/glutamate racemase family protein n=1 Tax=Mesobacterium pallidum TaxID=2872037 RepID=UPI001EE16536|nr:aspartate/glutamate racemase family protein [Mesobacterium pallidum]
MRILFINPNTSQAMAEVMATEARRIAAAGTVIDVCSAPFGSAYISTRGEAAVAGHALLTALAQNYDGHDAVIVGAFIVPAVTAAAKELCPVPLIATGEAGLAAASLVGQSMAILSIGDPARRMTEETVAATGLAARVVSIRDIGLTGTELTEDQPRADATAVALAQAAVTEDRADAIVLGAGSMEGMARRIQPQVPVPVISPVGAAVCMAEMLVRLGLPKATAGSYARASGVEMTGVDPVLMRLMRGD